jgi:hypothetical protein
MLLGGDYQLGARLAVMVVRVVQRMRRVGGGKRDAPHGGTAEMDYCRLPPDLRASRRDHSRTGASGHSVAVAAIGLSQGDGLHVG